MKVLLNKINFGNCLAIEKFGRCALLLRPQVQFLAAHSLMSDSATPWTVAHQVPLSMGILQARILEWVAMPSSRGSSQPRDQTHTFCIGRRVLYH